MADTETKNQHPQHAQHAQHATPKTAGDRMAEDKKQLAAEREQRAKDMAERDKHRGTPTPTQEECDLAKLGHHPQLADDGSGPDPNEKLNTVRHIGAKPPASNAEYQTRAAAPKV
ncbi:MAG TPA: hypothetical protein VGH47_04510 [Xanthobacteraceae bacterium]|jgi:hypothetical protein